MPSRHDTVTDYARMRRRTRWTPTWLLRRAEARIVARGARTTSVDLERLACIRRELLVRRVATRRPVKATAA